MDQILAFIWTKLHSAVTDKDDPWRTLTLATSSDRGLIHQRSVILRAVEDKQAIVFFTDHRSNKVRSIEGNSQVSLHSYDAHLRIQLSCQGTAIIEKVEDHEYDNFTLRSLKDYNTLLPPGTHIQERLDVLRGDIVHMARIIVELTKISYLKLERDRHTRIEYSKKQGQWYGQYLVP